MHILNARTVSTENMNKSVSFPDRLIIAWIPVSNNRLLYRWPSLFCNIEETTHCLGRNDYHIKNDTGAQLMINAYEVIACVLE